MAETFVAEKNKIIIRAGHSLLWLIPGIITFGMILLPLLAAIFFAFISNTPFEGILEKLTALFVVILWLAFSTHFSNFFLLAFGIANTITFHFSDQCVYRKGLFLTKKIADLPQITDIVRVDRSAWIFKKAYYKMVMHENRFGKGIRITKLYTPSDPGLAEFEQEILPQIIKRRIRIPFQKSSVSSSPKNFFRKEGDCYIKKFRTSLVIVSILLIYTLSFLLSLLIPDESMTQDQDFLYLLLLVNAFLFLTLLLLPRKIVIDTKTRTISRYTVLGFRCKTVSFDRVTEICVIRSNYDSWFFNSTEICLGISGLKRPMPIATQILPEKLDVLADELPALLRKTLPFVYIDANRTSPFTLLAVDPRTAKEYTAEISAKTDEKSRTRNR